MIESFYNQLSPYYKYIFQDWNASVDRQAIILDQVICEYFGKDVRSILDADCGIGTQTIGLAQKGYQLTASDISEGEIEKERLEASQQGLDVTFCVADMHDLQQTFRAKSVLSNNGSSLSF